MEGSFAQAQKCLERLHPLCWYSAIKLEWELWKTTARVTLISGGGVSAVPEFSSELFPLRPPSIRVNHRGGGKARRELEEAVVFTTSVTRWKVNEGGQVENWRLSNRVPGKARPETQISLWFARNFTSLFGKRLPLSGRPISQHWWKTKICHLLQKEVKVGGVFVANIHCTENLTLSRRWVGWHQRLIVQ